MNTKLTRVLTLLLALVMVVGLFAACTDDDEKKPSNSGEKVESEYAHYQNHGGATYSVLNVIDPLWNMITCLNPAEQTDEVRQNIYVRNQKVFANSNAKIDEQTNEGVEYKMNSYLEASIISGATPYAAAFMPLYHAKTMVPSGYYQSLNDVSTLHLDQSYWDKEMLDRTSVAGNNYFATGDVHMMSFESMWCLFFNKDMMEDKDMEYPYQLVKDGEWTFEKFAQYCAQAKNLNGDSAYDKDAQNATFGCVSFKDVISKMITGMGEQYVTKDSADLPVLNIESSGFSSVCQTIANFVTTDGDYIMGEDDIKSEYYYELYFEQNRAMFLGAEIKAAQGFRETITEWEFGIVPLPKNTATDEYVSTSTYQTAAYVIPSNNEQPDKVSNIIDALGFESNTTVIQPYFGRTVEQKGLKDDDSIEMLNIIRNNRTYDVGIAYNWVRDFEVELQKLLMNGDSNVASLAKEYAEAVQLQIDKSVEWIQSNK